MRFDWCDFLNVVLGLVSDAIRQWSRYAASDLAISLSRSFACIRKLRGSKSGRGQCSIIFEEVVLTETFVAS